MASRDFCRCLVRNLKISPRSFESEAAVGASYYSKYPAERASRHGWSLPSSWRRTRLESGQFRSSPSRSDYILPSCMSLARVSSGFISRSIWMPLSTVSEEKQHINVKERATDVPNGSIASEVQASVEEFIPFTENTPHTPLVDAIKSQNFASFGHLPLPPVESSSSDLRQESSAPGNRSSLSAGDVRQITPTRVYIGGLPFEIRGEELIKGLSELCGQYGTVKDVSLSRYRNQSEKSIGAGKHRGFVFVTMETSDQAQALIDNLNGASIWGRVILVNHGLIPRYEESKKEKVVSRRKVFVGNLHESTSSADLEHHFELHGPIENIKLITDFGSKRSRGFAFLTFKEERQAMGAVLDKDGSILDGSVISVNIAKYPQAD